MKPSGSDIAGPGGCSDTSHVATPIEAPPEFPGCHPIRLTRDGLEHFEGRLEYWEASSETAWVISEPTTVTHEGPTRRLGRLAELIAEARRGGAPEENFTRQRGGPPPRIAQMFR